MSVRTESVRIRAESRPTAGCRPADDWTGRRVGQRRSTDQSPTHRQWGWPTIGVSQAWPTASHKGSARDGRRTNDHQWGGQPQAADHWGQPGVADHMSQATNRTQGVSQTRPTDQSQPHHQWVGQPHAADHRGQPEWGGQPEEADHRVSQVWPTASHTGSARAGRRTNRLHTTKGWSARGGRPSGQPGVADRKPHG
eukprot:4463896-Amphidinium_carterae.1